MIEYQKNEVKNLGEELHRVRWQGREWSVTDYGIEARDGRYVIQKDRIGEITQGGTWSWPQHMAEKGGIDMEDFVTAWLVAIALFGVRLAPDDIKYAIKRSLPQR